MTIFFPYAAVKDFIESHVLVKGLHLKAEEVYNIIILMIDHEEKTKEIVNVQGNDPTSIQKCSICAGIFEIDSKEGFVVCGQCGLVRPGKMFAPHHIFDVKTADIVYTRKKKDGVYSGPGFMNRLKSYTKNVETDARQQLEHLNVYTNLTETDLICALNRVLFVAQHNITIRCVASLLIPQINHLRFERGEVFDTYKPPLVVKRYKCNKCNQPVVDKWEENRHGCSWGLKKRTRVSEVQNIGLCWIKTQMNEKPPRTGKLNEFAEKLSRSNATIVRMSVKEWTDFKIVDLKQDHVVKATNTILYTPVTNANPMTKIQKQ